MSRQSYRAVTRRIYAATLIGMLTLLALPTRCRATTTITVSSLNDVGSSGICVVRDAITAANAGATVNGCVAATDTAYAIVFQSGLSGALMLGSPLPDIESNLTITGPASGTVAISGNNAVGIMTIDLAGAGGHTVALGNLTIENGRGANLVAGPIFGFVGGAIDNNGDLTITNSTFSGNQAIGGTQPAGTRDGDGGAIYNSGKLTVTDTAFSNNEAMGGDNLASLGQGGAIFNNGTLNLAGDTFTGNEAVGGFDANTNDPGYGGAIQNYAGALTITGSTFSDNEALGASGSDAQSPNSTFSEGGAIQIFAGAVSVTNSTFAGNEVISSPSFFSIGGAIGGTASVTNCTFFDNDAISFEATPGSGAAIYGGVTVKGSILAASTGSNCDQDITDAGYNMSDDGTCSFVSGSGSTVVASTSAVGLDSSGLAINGGPTLTIALTQLTGGAYNFIPSANCTDQSNPAVALTTDQRGYGRPVNSTCSAGAYQFNGPPPAALTVMPTLLDFPNTTVGQKSSAITVTLENTSSVPVDISSIGVGTDNFAVNNQCSSPLAAMTSCPVDVTFTPTTTGNLSATLSISDNVPGSPQTVALSGTGLAAIDCETAVASSPKLIAFSPLIFFPESVHGVSDPAGAFSIGITGVTQNKPVPRLVCPDAAVFGTTTFVRTNNEPLQGSSGLLYNIGFKATDTGSGTSCTGAVAVCVQDLFHLGQPCTGTATYNAMKCP